MTAKEIMSGKVIVQASGLPPMTIDNYQLIVNFEVCFVMGFGSLPVKTFLIGLPQSHTQTTPSNDSNKICAEAQQQDCFHFSV